MIAFYIFESSKLYKRKVKNKTCRCSFYCIWIEHLMYFKGFSYRVYSQPPGLSSNSINSIFLIDHCVYTVSVQCRREKLWIFCIVAVCTEALDRHIPYIPQGTVYSSCNYVFIKLSENVCFICVMWDGDT